MHLTTYYCRIVYDNVRAHFHVRSKKELVRVKVCMKHCACPVHVHAHTHARTHIQNSITYCTYPYSLSKLFIQSIRIWNQNCEGIEGIRDENLTWNKNKSFTSIVCVCEYSVGALKFANDSDSSSSSKNNNVWFRAVYSFNGNLCFVWVGFSSRYVQMFSITHSSILYMTTCSISFSAFFQFPIVRTQNKNKSQKKLRHRHGHAHTHAVCSSASCNFVAPVARYFIIVMTIWCRWEWAVLQQWHLPHQNEHHSHTHFFRLCILYGHRAWF